MAELVAIEHIEWNDADGTTHRLAPGDPIPAEFPKDDAKELRDNGAIGTAKDHASAIATRSADARRARVKAEAEALGLTVTD